MIELVKKVTRTLQIQYGLYIAFGILLVVLHELDVLTVGVYAGNAMMEYIFGTVAILVTIALVPFSLKLFSIQMEKKVVKAELERALALYQKWSTVRLMVLVFVTYLNVFIYYMTLNNIGGLCALIGLTASVFCLPSHKRMCEELHLTDKKENDNEKEL